jgi:hypothetical protein
MRNLDNFRNIHKGKDIYVVASGPSLDYINKSFFDNKITIGINQIYKKVKVNYLVRKEPEMIDEIFKTCDKNTVHFVSKGHHGGMVNKIKLAQFIQKYNKNNNIVLYNHNINKHEMPDVLPKDGLVTSYSTITTGIHLAAVMGAKNIILVGHDCGTLDNKCNTKNYHTKETISIAWKNGESDYRKWLPQIESHTIKLKGILKKNFKCEMYSLNPFINFNLEGHKYSKT